MPGDTPQNVLFPPIEFAPIGTSSVRPPQRLTAGAPLGAAPVQDASWLEFAHRQLRENPSPYMTVGFVRDTAKNLLGLPLALERARRGVDPAADPSNLLPAGMFDLMTMGSASSFARPRGVSGTQLLSVAGPGAKTADLRALARAKALQKGAFPPDYIQAQTGWIPTLAEDGTQKWMFEVPDRGMTLRNVFDRPLRYGDPTEKPGFYLGYDATQGRRHPRTALENFVAPENGRFVSLEGGPAQKYVVHDKQWDPAKGRYSRVRLGDLITHNELFDAYPGYKNMMLQSVDSVRPRNTSLFGYQLPHLGTMALGAQDLRKMRGTILHELTHQTQALEGLAQGGQSALFYPRNFYERLPALQRAAHDQFTKMRADLGPQLAARLQNEVIALEAHGQKAMTPTLDYVLDARPELAQRVADFAQATRAYQRAALIPTKAFDKYENLHGEQMARTVERRADMGPRALRVSPFWQDADEPDVLRHILTPRPMPDLP